MTFYRRRYRRRPIGYRRKYAFKKRTYRRRPKTMAKKIKRTQRRVKKYLRQSNKLTILRPLGRSNYKTLTTGAVYTKHFTVTDFTKGVFFEDYTLGDFISTGELTMITNNYMSFRMEMCTMQFRIVDKNGMIEIWNSGATAIPSGQVLLTNPIDSSGSDVDIWIAHCTSASMQNLYTVLNTDDASWRDKTLQSPVWRRLFKQRPVRNKYSNPVGYKGIYTLTGQTPTINVNTTLSTVFSGATYGQSFPILNQPHGYVIKWFDIAKYNSAYANTNIAGFDLEITGTAMFSCKDYIGTA